MRIGLKREGRRSMLNLEEIKKNRGLVNSLDWDMTPEEAVVLYLEWGNNWSHGKMVKSKQDVSYYFVVNTWGKDPKITLVRRNSDEAVEMGIVDLPKELGDRFLTWAADRKGVYPLNDEVKAWLKRELEA
jgi:hypothetical protein